jgi:DNA-directed RNA polymerase specialized sigma24 family protein
LQTTIGSQLLRCRPVPRAGACRPPLAKRHLVGPRWRAGETRFGQGGRSEKKYDGMTTLDHRLYAWLLESDERRFELAFKAYFDIAYPSVLRHLGRLSRWDPVHLEELAQDALLRFFDKVGRGRREASKEVSACLTEIRPLNFGAFHERQVIKWTSAVGSFRESAMEFRLPELEETTWKASIRALAERIPVLQGEGWHLLHSLHLALHWTFDDPDLAGTAPADKPIRDEEDDNRGMATDRNCDERLVEEMRTKTARASTAEFDHPGAAVFVNGTWVVVRALPYLRVPTNSYLFEIAQTIYLDECKKRGRQKRGGTGAMAAPESPDDESAHPIERLESLAADESDERYGDAVSIAVGSVTDRNVPSVDPTSQIENEDLFEKFYEYLRRPVDDAIEAFHVAQRAGRAIAERRRVESLTEKFSRTMSVLSVIGEGFTQEQTADRLGLSRNQVKYILELVQEAYGHFTADTARKAPRATAASEGPYAV